MAVVEEAVAVAVEQQQRNGGASRAHVKHEPRPGHAAPAPEPALRIAHVDLYQRLAAPFDSTFRDVRGGVELEYITGEQCISRLNEVLGVAGWSFKILEHGLHAEADEVWTLGEITASFGDTVVTRQQFGSQKVKRSRNSGTPLDIGFDLKGASTDALKKCASLLGVGLYLSRKEVPAASNGEANVHANGTNGTAGFGRAAAAAPNAGAADTGPLTCDACGDDLKETRFRDGTVWTPLQLAGYGRRKHSRTLCMTHYRDANEARKRSEANLDDLPF